MDLNFLDWPTMLGNLARIGIAYALALPVAWNREREARGAGLRTFPLVAIASCGYLLIAEKAFGSDVNAQARILGGLITGIGFIGGGAILKLGNDVRGVATATSIWATGAIGGAAAFSRYEIAVVISIVTFLTLRFMSPIKEKLDHKEEKPTASSLED